MTSAVESAVVPDWDDVLADIGDRVRAERRARSWTQVELCRRSGLSRETVKRLEAGRSGSTMRNFFVVCSVLGVAMDVLLSDQWQLPSPVRGPLLTDGQVKVLRAVSSGCPLAEAAAELGMQRDGVASRLSEIYRRLGVAGMPREERRQAAVRVATANGLMHAA